MDLPPGLPTFASERATDIRDDFHGSDGPIPVRRHGRDLTARRSGLIRGVSGIFPPTGHESPGFYGGGPYPMNNPNGIRMSTALTYLNPIRHRLNLTVKAHVLVRRLLLPAQRSPAWKSTAVASGLASKQGRSS